MWRLALLLWPLPALADSLVATRTIRAQTPITTEDITAVAAEIPGALTDPAQAIGQEARVVIYAGRPVLAADLGPAAIVLRNQIVPLAYAAGGLVILTEGRALARGGVGEVIDVMNMASRTRVRGRVGADGVVHVDPAN